jgi:hypothetical protein
MYRLNGASARERARGHDLCRGSSMRVFKASLIWLVMLIFAVLNGALREAVLLPHLGKPVSFVISGALLSACIVVVALMLMPRVGPMESRDALYIGLFWVLLTLAFEFTFGRLVQHREWAELLDAYRFRDGNIWPVVLAVMLFAPLMAVRLRRRPR